MTSSTGTISKDTVIIKRLHADHGQQSFKRFLPLNPGDEVIGRVATTVARDLGCDDGSREQEISRARGALSLPQ